MVGRHRASIGIASRGGAFIADPTGIAIVIEVDFVFAQMDKGIHTGIGSIHIRSLRLSTTALCFSSAPFIVPTVSRWDTLCMAYIKASA